MGRRRAFDKKNSVTYSLIHTSAPAGEQPERLWIEKSRGVGVGRPDVEANADLPNSRDYPTGHPLSFFQYEPASDLTEEQRQEMVDLGLPDDGYDYLKHLRDVAGSGKAEPSSEGAESILLESTLTQGSRPATVVRSDS